MFVTFLMIAVIEHLAGTPIMEMPLLITHTILAMMLLVWVCLHARIILSNRVGDAAGC